MDSQEPSLVPRSSYPMGHRLICPHRSDSTAARSTALRCKLLRSKTPPSRSKNSSDRPNRTDRQWPLKPCPTPSPYSASHDAHLVSFPRREPLEHQAPQSEPTSTSTNSSEPSNFSSELQSSSNRILILRSLLSRKEPTSPLSAKSHCRPRAQGKAVDASSQSRETVQFTNTYLLWWRHQHPPRRLRGGDSPLCSTSKGACTRATPPPSPQHFFSPANHGKPTLVFFPFLTPQ